MSLLTFLPVHVITTSFRSFRGSSTLQYCPLFTSILVQVLHLIPCVSLSFFDPRLEDHNLILDRLEFILLLAKCRFNAHPDLNVILSDEAYRVSRLARPSSTSNSVNVCFTILRHIVI